jgi:formate dehydrogenase maturation protein FdhE
VPADPTKRVARRVASVVGNAVLARAASDVTAGVDLSAWRWPECPCCSGAPDLALCSDRQRTLVCWRCDTRWPAMHRGCLGCGAADAPTIARVPSPYLGYELAICNACGRYLKERRGAPSHDLLIERIIVAGLDAAAQQRGLRA